LKGIGYMNGEGIGEGRGEGRGRRERQGEGRKNTLYIIEGEVYVLLCC
jgi:hypothetical protein